MKRLILVCVMILCLVPLGGWAEEASTEAPMSLVCGDYEYILLEDGTAEITSYLGDARDLVIPGVLDGYSVTRIGDGAFESPIREEWSFPTGISNLMNVTIPEGVISIGDNAFSLCSALQSITIPDTVTSIGDYVFFGCVNLRNITIPNSVVSVGANPIRYCWFGTTISVSPDHPALAIVDGVLYAKSDQRLIQGGFSSLYTNARSAGLSSNGHSLYVRSVELFCPREGRKPSGTMPPMTFSGRDINNMKRHIREAIMMKQMILVLTTICLLCLCAVGTAEEDTFPTQPPDPSESLPATDYTNTESTLKYPFPTQVEGYTFVSFAGERIIAWGASESYYTSALKVVKLFFEEVYPGCHSSQLKDFIISIGSDYSFAQKAGDGAYTYHLISLELNHPYAAVSFEVLVSFGYQCAFFSDSPYLVEYLEALETIPVTLEQADAKAKELYAEQFAENGLPIPDEDSLSSLQMHITFLIDHNADPEHRVWSIDYFEPQSPYEYSLNMFNYVFGMEINADTGEVTYFDWQPKSDVREFKESLVKLARKRALYQQQRRTLCQHSYIPQRLC